MKIAEVRDVSSAAFAQALEIYRQSFPANERHPDDKITSRVHSGFYRLETVQEDGKVILMALLHDFAGTAYTLLDYLALHPDARGDGKGSDFLKHLATRTSSSGKRLLLEVEDPSFGDNHGERKRRIKFYSKCGASVLHSVPYKMPPLAGGEPTEMLLLVAPAGDADIIDGGEIRSIVTRLYDEVYSRKSGDPLLVGILEKIPERVAVRSLP